MFSIYHPVEDVDADLFVNELTTFDLDLYAFNLGYFEPYNKPVFVLITFELTQPIRP